MSKILKFMPGEIYEDCSYHPCLCIGVDNDKREIWGISLIDGSQPRGCDIDQCGVRKLTPEQAWKWKIKGPQALDGEPKPVISPENKWW